MGSAGEKRKADPHGSSEGSANDRSHLVDLLKAVLSPTVWKRNLNIRAPDGISERHWNANNPCHRFILGGSSAFVPVTPSIRDPQNIP
jgi:hypothetical protein